MATPRQLLIDQIDRALGRRRLYWFGTRGSDALSLAEVPQFSGSFSIIDRFPWDLEWVDSWEDRAGYRVDLDEWDIDEHVDHPATRGLRAALLTAMDYDHAIVPYRPCDFLSDLVFVRRQRSNYLGLFSAHQRAFEHKPWVETAVYGMDMGWLEWQHLARRDRALAETQLAAGPVVIRPSRGSGGIGMRRIDTVEELDPLWPTSDDTYINISRYRDNALPLNVGAVVWADGVTVHFPSAQIIGVSACTTLPFGYCGNDFSLASQLPVTVIDEIERTVVELGNWLRGQGFLGAFGVDYLLNGGELLFTEINPRFQGSTKLSAQLSAARDEACILLDHTAALLGVHAPDRPHLRDVVGDLPAAHVVVHNTSGTQVHARTKELATALRPLLSGFDSSISIDPGIPALPGATLMAAQTTSSVTTDGYSLSYLVEDTIRTTLAGAVRVAEEVAAHD